MKKHIYMVNLQQQIDLLCSVYCQAVYFDIDELGDLAIYQMVPDITPEENNYFTGITSLEIRALKRDRFSFFYTKGCSELELVNQPNKYHDNRFEIFWKKETVMLYLYLVDSTTSTVVGAKGFYVDGIILDKLKRALIDNYGVGQMSFERSYAKARNNTIIHNFEKAKKIGVLNAMEELEIEIL